MKNRWDGGSKGEGVRETEGGGDERDRLVNFGAQAKEDILNIFRLWLYTDGEAFQIKRSETSIDRKDSKEARCGACY